MRKIIAYFSIFSDAKITRESLVIESLSEMSLDSLASYYIDNPEERCFIYPILNEKLIKDLGEQDYRYIKAVHDAFCKTDLFAQIDSVYLPLRQNLLVEVKPHMHDYFQHETSVLHELYKEIWHNAQLTLSHNLPVIIDSGKTEVLQLDVLDIRIFSST